MPVWFLSRKVYIFVVRQQQVTFVQMRRKIYHSSVDLERAFNSPKSCDRLQSLCTEKAKGS